MSHTKKEVPHVWEIEQKTDGSIHGCCLRCKAEVQATDSEDFAATEIYPCTISERSSHELYIEVRCEEDAWICHHCGLTSTMQKQLKAIGDDSYKKCIYPNPNLEKGWKVNTRHTWTYIEEPSVCRCTCKSCGYTITASSKPAAALLTAREDKNIPCTVKVDEKGNTEKTVFTPEDPEYAERCKEILEGLVHLQALRDDESLGLEMMVLHEQSFNKLFDTGIALVSKYREKV